MIEPRPIPFWLIAEKSHQDHVADMASKRSARIIDRVAAKYDRVLSLVLVPDFERPPKRSTLPFAWPYNDKTCAPSPRQPSAAEQRMWMPIDNLLLSPRITNRLNDAVFVGDLLRYTPKQLQHKGLNEDQIRRVESALARWDLHLGDLPPEVAKKSRRHDRPMPRPAVLPVPAPPPAPVVAVAAAPEPSRIAVKAIADEVARRFEENPAFCRKLAVPTPKPTPKPAPGPQPKFQDYPRWMFHRKLEMVLVQNAEEEAALGAEWSRKIWPKEDPPPVAPPEQPIATPQPVHRRKPSVEEMLANQPRFTRGDVLDLRDVRGEPAATWQELARRLGREGFRG